MMTLRDRNEINAPNTETEREGRPVRNDFRSVSTSATALTVLLFALLGLLWWAGALPAQSPALSPSSPATPAPSLSPGPSQPPISHLVRLVQLTDTHIVDQESPARWVKFGGVILNGIRIESAYRTYEDSAPRVLDALVRAVNRIHRSGTPISAVLHTGDMIDNGQRNEFTWFLASLRGGTVDPDSGLDDDPLPGPDNDPADPFVAEGLDPAIPWYAIPGNHDLMTQGNVLFSQAELFRMLIFGLFAIPAPEGGFSRAVIRPRSPLLPPLTDADLKRLPIGEIPADPRRAYLSREELVRMATEATGGAEANGFSSRRVDEMDYGVNPVPDVPLRVIFLDTVNTYSGLLFGVYPKRSVARFLRPELEAALARKELVILANHHPVSGLIAAKILNVDDGTPRLQPYQPGTWMTSQEMVDLVGQYPNVILWLAGHDHHHQVLPHGRPDGSAWYEVNTSSLLDAPQQARLLTISWNEGEGTARVSGRLLSPDFAASPLAARAHRLAAESAVTHGEHNEGEARDREFDLEIPVKFPPAEVR